MNKTLLLIKQQKWLSKQELPVAAMFVNGSKRNE
jgi:penicillin-binding protein-related factor A (putative recombinase)